MALHILILMVANRDLSTPEERDTDANPPKIGRAVAAGPRRPKEEHGGEREHQEKQRLTHKTNTHQHSYVKAVT